MEALLSWLSETSVEDLGDVVLPNPNPTELPKEVLFPNPPKLVNEPPGLPKTEDEEPPGVEDPKVKLDVGVTSGVDAVDFASSFEANRLVVDEVGVIVAESALAVDGAAESSLVANGLLVDPNADIVGGDPNKDAEEPNDDFVSDVLGAKGLDGAVDAPSGDSVLEVKREVPFEDPELAGAPKIEVEKVVDWSDEAFVENSEVDCVFVGGTEDVNVKADFDGAEIVEVGVNPPPDGVSDVSGLKPANDAGGVGILKVDEVDEGASMRVGLAVLVLDDPF